MKYNILIFAFLVNAFVFAQKSEFKFGKISEEELEQSQHPLEKDAEAAILYKKERLHYEYNSEDGFKTHRDAHYRIKIYNKSGLDRGTIEVPLYTSKNGEEKISSVKGYTYNIEGGKIMETKLKKDGIFKENVNKYRNKASIVMPEVKEGSIVELQYTIISDFAGNIDDFQFQYGIPVDKVETSLEIPEYYVFKRYGRGFYPIDIKQSRKTRKITMRYRVQGEGASLRSVGSGNTTRTSDIEFAENIYNINATNIPSLKKVAYTDNINNYRSSLKFELASTRFPGSNYKNYSFTWDDVAKAIYDYDSFGNQLKKTRDVESVVKTIVDTTADKKQLLKNIFDHVKSHMTWNNYYGVGCENGFKKAHAQKKGNVADINLMLTAMLREAGFKANPVLVSTKSHGIPLFPTNDGFNYVIAAVENPGGGVTLMDATEKMGAVGMLPSRAINWKGRLIRKDGTSEEIALEPKKPAVKMVSLNVQILEDGSIEGNLAQRMNNGFAFDYRETHKDDTLDDIMEEMENQYLEMEVDDLKIKNWKDCDKPLVESCLFMKENQIEEISGKLYFKPALFLSINENPFKLEEREYPVDFKYPWSQNLIVNFKLPEGYQVESIPDSMSLALPEGMGSFKYRVVTNAAGIQFICNTSINSGIIPPNYYQALKEFYNQLVVKHSERIVLTKA